MFVICGLVLEHNPQTIMRGRRLGTWRLIFGDNGTTYEYIREEAIL
jgi:hypothetical protein